MIPKIIYGTAWKKERTASLVDKALAAGFRAIDVANQPKHYNEPGVGEGLRAWLKTHDRAELFLQTKFTPIDGQDQRVPYDPEVSITEQVRQSFESSLEHLGVSSLDSLLLHGPYNHSDLGKEDFEVWAELERLNSTGKVKAIGISNVNLEQLRELVQHAPVKPHFVQNRCFAARGWDASVRNLCAKEGIVYQGFSLLTANPEVVMSSIVHELAARHHCTPPEIVFAYARVLGILPLTGTCDETHMMQDLTPRDLNGDEIETLRAFAPG